MGQQAFQHCTFLTSVIFNTLQVYKHPQGFKRPQKAYKYKHKAYKYGQGIPRLLDHAWFYGVIQSVRLDLSKWISQSIPGDSVQYFAPNTEACGGD